MHPHAIKASIESQIRGVVERYKQMSNILLWYCFVHAYEQEIILARVGFTVIVRNTKEHDLIIFYAYEEIMQVLKVSVQEKMHASNI